MDFVTPLYHTLQAQANLEHTQAVTQDTRALAQMRMLPLIQNLMARQAYANMPGVGPGGGGPGNLGSSGAGAQANGPGNPLAVAGAVMTAQDQPQSPLQQINDQIGALQKQADWQNQAARTMFPINPQLGETHAKLEADIREKISTKMVDALKEKANLEKTLGGYAGGVTNQDSLDLAVSRMDALNPTASRSIPMDRDPITQRPMATPRTVANFNAFADQSTTRAEQFTDKHRLATEALAASSEARRAQDAIDNRLSREQTADQTAEIRRQGQAIERDRLANQGQNRQLNLAERIGNDYARESKDFKEKVPYIQTATNYLFDSDGNPRPTSAFTPAQDKGLAEAYIKTVFPDYKGSVYDKKGLDNLGSLPTRFVQYFVNLAEGKELPNNVRQDMFNAMQAQFKNENAQQMAREDNYRQRLLQANVDPAIGGVYVQPYALRPLTKSEPAPAPQGGGDVQSGRGGKQYRYIGGPNGDRSLKSNWEPVGGGT